jgi:putative (di)nucleoside polyphosphate hydrolase
MSTASERDLSRYRPNVGIVLFNADGLVWLGRRAGAEGPFNWQFPQGGVDEGESLDDAALRELTEETGVQSVAFLAATEGWITYDFPPEVLASGRGRGFLGQKQVWYAFRFEGPESEIDLGAHHEVEFDAWKWVPIAQALESVAPFKREAYAEVIAAFSGLAVA